jgi:LmbE family N-acetylglucosaminyl deacetylase
LKSLVVVAHPDDETLWFSPILAHADLIVVAFPRHPSKEEINRGREAVWRDFGLPIELLPVDTAPVLRKSDWANPKLTTYGVELLDTCPPDVRSQYIANYDRLLAALDPYVAESEHIYSHNPWGEYGHEAHIQVWSVVSRLARERGRTLWVWDGLTNDELLERGSRVRLEYFTPLPEDLKVQALEPDLEMYQRLKQLYERHDVWTFRADYVPPDRLRYLEAVRRGSQLLTAADANRRPSSLNE